MFNVMIQTSKYRTLNTSNIDTSNFEHFEHDPQILRPNFEQARPNIELLSKIKNTNNSANKKSRRKKQEQKIGTENFEITQDSEVQFYPPQKKFPNSFDIFVNFFGRKWAFLPPPNVREVRRTLKPNIEPLQTSLFQPKPNFEPPEHHKKPNSS